MPLVRPWLPRTHPNFFVIYAFTLVTHLWFGFNGIFGTRRDFSSPIYIHVNAFASHQTWGWVQFSVGAALYLGLHCRTFKLSRFALAAGLATMIMRVTLVAFARFDGVPVGNTLPNLFLIAGLLLSQTLEPPSNPDARRADG